VNSDQQGSELNSATDSAKHQKCSSRHKAVMKLKEEQTLKGHNGRVWGCSWSPSGNLLATCGEDANVRLWSSDDSGVWSCVTILTEAHTRTVRSVEWSPCGNFLATASFDGTVAVWDRKSGQFECSATLEGHENEVKWAAFSRSGNFLASCSRDKSVWIWDVDQEEEEYSCASVLQAHTQDVKKVVWHPELDVVASCSYDNRIKMYREDDDDWICFATLSSHTSTVWAAAFDKLGTRLVSVGDDATVKIWHQPEYNAGDVSPSWKCQTTLGGEHSRCIYDVDWSKTGDNLIATASGDDAIRLFGETSESGFSLKCTKENSHDQDVNGVAWNPVKSGILASVSDDGTAKIWNVLMEEDDIDLVHD